MRLASFRDHEGAWRQIWKLSPAQIKMVGFEGPRGWSRVEAADLGIEVLGYADDDGLLVCVADARLWAAQPDAFHAAGRRCRDLDCTEAHG